MALIKSIQLNNGLLVENAYIRIDTINGNKNSLQISVNSYMSKESFANGIGYLEQNFYNFEPNMDDGSSNFIKQGYEHLKTLDIYREAIDC